MTTEKVTLAFLDNPVARNHIAQTLAQEVSGGFNTARPDQRQGDRP